MKILAVIGSARKGNTYKAVQAIEKEMKTQGDVSFEYLHLANVDLKTCRGCSVCLLYGESKCPIKDDRPMIEKKIKEADGVIFASPNYVCNVSSLMKNFIDRFAYCGHRPRFFHKPTMLVCTSAGPGGIKDCMKSLSIIKTGGYHIVERLLFITPYFKLSESMDKQYKAKLTKSAVNFYKKVKKPGAQKPSLGDIVKFRAVRSFVICKPEQLPNDYEYWKAQGWLDEKTYFYDVPMNIFKRIFGWLTEKMCDWFYINIMFKDDK